MAAVNALKEKFKKTVNSSVCNRLKFAKLSGKTYCVRKCKKMGIENLFRVAL